MRITGSATLHASRADVWAALNDPALLVATIPGCQALEAVATDSYAMTVSAGVGAIKGVYRGEVRLDEKQEPDRFTLHASGAGTPGTLAADVVVTLTEVEAATTAVAYDADAVVGGLVAGVGQRMIAGVAKKTAAEFFGAVDNALNGLGPPADAGTTTSRPTGVLTAPPSGLPSGAGSFRSGAIVGAFAALAGAVVGAWLSGRRRT